MMTALLLLLSSLLGSNATAATRAVMEGTKVSNEAIFIDTVTPRVRMKSVRISTGNVLYFFGDASLGGDNYSMEDIELYHGSEGRLVLASLGNGQITALDIYPTTGTKPNNEGLAELTIHRKDKVLSSGTNFEQLSFGSLPDVLGGIYFFSMESGTTGGSVLRDFQLRHETGSGETWNGVNGPRAGEENFLTFAATRTFHSVPIVLVNGHFRFDRDGQIDRSDTYWLGRATGTLTFNVPAYSSYTWSISGSTYMHLNAGGGDAVPRLGIGMTNPLTAIDSSGTIRAFNRVFTSPSSGKGLELYYNSDIDSGVVDSNERTGGLTRKPLYIGGTPISFANNGVVEATLTGTGLGIKTASPTHPLHVIGNVRLSSSAIVGSTLTVQGSAFSVGNLFVISGGSVSVNSASKPADAIFFSSGSIIVRSTTTTEKHAIQTWQDSSGNTVGVARPDGLWALGINDVFYWDFGKIEFTVSLAAPTVGSGATDCGTNPAITGSGLAGRVTVGTGINGGKCTVTFGIGYITDVFCLAQNTTTANLAIAANQTTSGFEITGTLVAGDNLVYHCIGQI